MNLPCRQLLGSCWLIIFMMFGAVEEAAGEEPSLTNIVVILLDDSGYSDFRPFGETAYPMPHVERLAAEGRRFTRFHVPQAVCSASRAALLTGCDPGRTKVFGAHIPLERGLEPRFPTMAEVFQGTGYATGWFGKWHVGDQDDTRPHRRGFAETAGLMYSNDMWEHHLTDPVKWGRHPLQFWENGAVKIERMGPEEQKMLTTWVTTYATAFIKRNRAKPFFLYVAHPMPHVPLFCSDRFLGKSGNGLYADVMMELDWSVGEIMDALRVHGLEENTVVVFTSDNGPWNGYGNHAGSTPFRESKGTSFSGGTQSALIIKAPGELAPGTVSNVTFSSIDLFPTLAALTGTPLPPSPIDGRDLRALLRGDVGATNPHAFYPISTGTEFEAIISGDGRWKLHLPHRYREVLEPGNDGHEGAYAQRWIELSLFDLEHDPFESINLIEQHPDVGQALLLLAEQHRSTFYPPPPALAFTARSASPLLGLGGSAALALAGVWLFVAVRRRRRI